MAKQTTRRVEMILLDSNIIIYLSKELIKIDEVFYNNNEIYAVSIIGYMEVMGFSFVSMEEKEFIENLFSCLSIIYIDEKIAKKTIELRCQYKIKLPDAIICATTILNNGILCSNDIKLKTIEKLNLKIMGI